MNSVPPFLMFYVYKGQSYSAHNQLESFFNELERNQDVWKKIENYYQTD
ncbi:MAG: hypothetical protein ACFE9T_13000 [Promethearchaeota archaeon]